MLCLVTKICKLVCLLKKVDLVIWDKVPIQHRHCFEIVHCLFVDLQGIDKDLLFRDMLFIFSRDFVQILSIIQNSSQPDIVKACLQQSFI
jgi:ATP-dependent DNA helicase PIF1